MRELAADNNLAIRPDRHRPDRAIGTESRIEAGIHGTITIQARDVMTIHAIERSEITANNNFAIQLQRHCIDRIVRAAVRGDQESGVLIAVGQQTHDAVIRVGIV